MSNIDNNDPNRDFTDGGNKTFTQDEVNRIIGERLAKEKAKSEADLAKREQELAQKELELSAKAKMAEMGLPAELIGALNISTPEAMANSMDIAHKVIDSVRQEQSKLDQPRLHGPKPGQPTPWGVGAPDNSVRKAMGLS